VRLAYVDGPASLAKLVDRTAARSLRDAITEFVAVSRAKSRFRYQRQLLAVADTLALDATVPMLTTAVVERFLAGVVGHANAKNGMAGRPITEATRNRYRAAISAFASWCVRRGYLTKHPTAFRAVPRRPEPRGRMPRPLTPDDYAGLLAALPTETIQLAVRTLLESGGDIGEVMAMQPRDVEVGAQIALVALRRSKTNTPERFVPITKALGEALRAHASASHVFPPPTTARHVYVAVQRAGTAIGREKLRVKDLRHLAAIRWRQAGVDLLQVSRWLGHSSLTETQIYADYEADEQTRAAIIARATAVWAPGHHTQSKGGET
jgi:integrase